MAFWLGTMAFVVLVVLIAMGLRQRRTLVPIFEKERMLQDVAAFPGYPFYWLEGPFLCGARYALALAMVALTPAHMLEREQATFPCTKAEFMRHFSRGDVWGAVVFAILGLTYLVLIILVYFLKPPDADAPLAARRTPWPISVLGGVATLVDRRLAGAGVES